METKKQNIIEKYLDTKQKKIVAGCLAGVLVIGVAIGDHSAITGHSYHVTKVQTGTKHHDAVTHQETKTVTVTPAYDETVVVKQAYDETITTGYKCLCGATK